MATWSATACAECLSPRSWASATSADLAFRNGFAIVTRAYLQAMPLRLAILTISDAGSRGERSDSSGDLIASWAKERGYTLADRALVPDETGHIAALLAEWADGGRADVILTTGGTGLTARDVTPEATRTILEKEAPGIAEALRMSAYTRYPRAALSRGTAGVRAKTLIVNLPGGTGGVRDGLTVLNDLVEHAVELVSGEKTGH
jgi:molybdenum cofactor synthesis domain-containing protein